MKGKSAFNLIKPCSIILKRLSFHYGESKTKIVFGKARKKSKILVTPRTALFKENEKCIKCGASFKDEGRLDHHTKSFHEGLKPHKCIKCEYTCASKKSLNTHVTLY